MKEEVMCNHGNGFVQRLVNRIAQHPCTREFLDWVCGSKPKEKKHMPDLKARAVAAQARLTQLEGLVVPKQIDITLKDAQGNRVTLKGQDKDGWKYTNRLLARAFSSLLEDGLEEYKHLLGECVAEGTDGVVIEVRDGVASVRSNPKNVNVIINDMD